MYSLRRVATPLAEGEDYLRSVPPKQPASEVLGVPTPVAWKARTQVGDRWASGRRAGDSTGLSVHPLMSDRLSVTFEPYQLGPYAIGFQSVEVPYYDLRYCLKTDGPHTLAQSSGGD